MGRLAGAGGAGLPGLAAAAGFWGGGWGGSAVSWSPAGSHCVGGTGVAVLGLGAMGSVCRGGPWSVGREKEGGGAQVTSWGAPAKG